MLDSGEICLFAARIGLYPIAMPCSGRLKVCQVECHGFDLDRIDGINF